MDYVESQMAAANQYVAKQVGGPISKPASLTDIAEYVERIEKAAAIVREFNDRFRPMPQNSCASEVKAPSLVGYAGDITRLNREVAALEGAVAQLQKIG